MTRPDDIGSTPEDNGPARVISIYNARDWLGDVNVARTIRATRPDGSEIGTFDTVEAARRAVVLDAYAGREGGE